MEESTTYQLIIKLGRHKFGEPDATTKSALETIKDQAQLDVLCLRLLVATTWQEFLS